MGMILTEKLGPLPVWAWTAIGAAGVAVVLYSLRGKGGAEDTGSGGVYDPGSAFAPVDAPPPAAPPPTVVVVPTPGAEPSPEPEPPPWWTNPPDWWDPKPAEPPAPSQPAPAPSQPAPAQPAPAQPAPPAPSLPAIGAQLAGFFGETIFRLPSGQDVRLRRTNTMDYSGSFAIDFADTATWNPYGAGVVTVQGDVVDAAGRILGHLNPTQLERLTWGSNTGTISGPATDLAYGRPGYGQAIIDWLGVAVRATRVSAVRPDGSYDVTLGNTRDWSDFGYGTVDALGNVHVGGKTIYTLNDKNKASLQAGTAPGAASAATTAAAQPVAAAAPVTP